MEALIIRQPFIGKVLSGVKTWEMRSTRATKRGLIGLIEKGSGKVVGVANLIDSLGPLAEAEMLANMDRHCIPPDRLSSGETSKWRHAWVLQGARPLRTPIAYTHRSGAVIWVRLDDSIAAAVRFEMNVASQ